jgi:ribulose-5-phosphate 4-epimerase/fuculose-1-phosphate aldolase
MFMDEWQLRTSISQAAGQLWLRGLIAGDQGMVTAELHRRRYLACPTKRRRADLQPADMICVDFGGMTMEGEGEIEIDQWLPHRLAYQCGLDLPEVAQRNGGGESPAAISATVLAHPPSVMALWRRNEQAASLPLRDWPTVPIVNLDDNQALGKALLQFPVAVIVGYGLLAVGADVVEAHNWIERAEHAASIELAAGR